MGRTPTIARSRHSKGDLDRLFTTIVFATLALFHAIVLVGTRASLGYVSIGVAAFAATVVVAVLAKPATPRLIGLCLVGMVAFANFGSYLRAVPEPAWRLGSVAVLFGYAFSLAAVVLSLLFRRQVAAPLLSAAILWMSGVALEVVLESRTAMAFDFSRVKWIGPVQSHPVLGHVYVPHSTLRTAYPDNPRGYFLERDKRAARWELKINHPSSAGRLDLPSDRPHVIRVAIDLAGQPTSWHLQLAQAGIGVEARRSYRLTFRVKADKPRTIEYGMAQAHPPWDGLGYYRTRDVDTEWRDVVEVFQLKTADDNASLQFNLGGHPASVEFDNIELRDISSGDSLEPALAPEYFVEYRFNTLGCRGPEYPTPRPADRPRVLAVGDSFVLGVGVHEADTFEAQLERLLNDERRASGSATRYDVVNCGVTGYSPKEARVVYETVAPRYQPNVVILALVQNDDRSWHEEVQQQLFHEPSSTEQMIRLWNVVQTSRYEGRKPPVSFANAIADIRALRDRVERDGAALVVTIFRNNPLQAGNWGELVRQVTEGLAGDGIAVVDLGVTMNADEAWRQLVVHERFDLHPNEVAHRSAALQLHDLMRTRGLIRP